MEIINRHFYTDGIGALYTVRYGRGEYEVLIFPDVNYAGVLRTDVYDTETGHPLDSNWPMCREMIELTRDAYDAEKSYR